MPKYLLLKHYRGGPEPHHPFPPMDQWATEDVEAHINVQRRVVDVLRENGEYVDAQALTPTRTWVRYGGPDAAPVTTDGPHPETSELVAGWYMIDVESYERALELAAYVSSEPGLAESRCTSGSTCARSCRRRRRPSDPRDAKHSWKHHQPDPNPLGSRCIMPDTPAMLPGCGMISRFG
jgi:hypothetical protein